VWAADGMQVIAAARLHQPSAILLDLGMLNLEIRLSERGQVPSNIGSIVRSMGKVLGRSRAKYMKTALYAFGCVHIYVKKLGRVVTMPDR